MKRIGGLSRAFCRAELGETMTKRVAIFVIIWTIGIAGDCPAQTSGTSVVRHPSEIIYKGLPAHPNT